MIQWAIERGVNNISILKGNTFINLSPICLYQRLCKLLKYGNRLEEDQYCVGSVTPLLPQGVGGDVVQIKANTFNFKYST